MPTIGSSSWSTRPAGTAAARSCCRKACTSSSCRQPHLSCNQPSGCGPWSTNRWPTAPLPNWRPWKRCWSSGAAPWRLIPNASPRTPTSTAGRQNHPHECSSDYPDSVLAQDWGIDVSQLDAEVRRRIIFQGNASVQDELNAISDAFEHGYRPIPELRSRAASVVNDAARLVRAGILKACKLDSLSTATLLGPPFEEVQPMYPITAVVKGKLRGGGSDLAAPGERHPVIEWESSVVGVQQAEGSRANYQIEARSTRNRLGHGIEFEIEQIGFVVPPGVNVSQEPVQLRTPNKTGHGRALKQMRAQPRVRKA